MTHPTRPRTTRALRPTLLAAACTLALGACSSSDDDDMTDITPDPVAPGTERYAFVASALAGAGQIERLTIGDEIVSSGTTTATTTDIRVATDGTDVYEIGRFNLDRLTRFRVDALMTPVWQYSVNGVETTVNPYEIVFASDTKAYVVRYGSPFVWIVDPTAATEETFMTGQIDLSAYNDNTANGDMTPNPSDAVLVGDALYVLMENLGGEGGFEPLEPGYVAIIDTTTDTEIDTDPESDGLPGITLASRNPGGLLHPEDSDVVYVVGRGNIFVEFNGLPGDPYDGGIETIDTESFERSLLLDDGTMDDNEGFFSDALVVSPSKGYVVTSTGSGMDALRAFDPVTGTLADGVVAGLENEDISTLALGPEGRVWVGLNVADENATDRGFLLLDPSDDSIAEALVPTEFNPLDIVFVDAPATAGN